MGYFFLTRLTPVLATGSLLLLACTPAFGEADLSSTAAPSVYPPAAGEGQTDLGFKWSEMIHAGNSRDGFFLCRFNGRTVDRIPLPEVKREGDNLEVSSDDPDLPRFSFHLTEGKRHLGLVLTKIEAGHLADHGTSLLFHSTQPGNMVPVLLDYMTVDHSNPDGYTISWPYLWNQNTKDPLGGVAFYKAGDAASEDRSLAEIWVQENQPHPDIGRPWTEDEVWKWLQAYYTKFAGVSESTIAASNLKDLYALTDRMHDLGIRRIYLHTDTWRGEYWPVHHSFIDVNRQVFPAGVPDLIKYSSYLHGKGMLLQLHNVSGGIGPQDPEFVQGESIDPRLASWVHGKLAEPTSASSDEILFKPDPGTSLPHLRLDRYWSLQTFHFNQELIQAGEIQDTDKPIWRLVHVQRGMDGTKATAHDPGEGVTGLYNAYGQNFIPDVDSDLLDLIAKRYADFVNQVPLDTCFYDGAEIHVTQDAWGFEKYSYLIYKEVNRAATSNTSSGRMPPWNYEIRFSKIGALKEIGCWDAETPILLENERNTTSWLDSNFAIAEGIINGGRRLGFYKPQPMFGVTLDTLSKDGLMPRYKELLRHWQTVMPYLKDDDVAYLGTLLQRVKSPLGQAGNHFQGYDVPVLEKRDDGYYLVPTRILTRPGVDAPILVGQEFGTVSPKQYLQPGDKLTLPNPYAAQPPGIVLHLLNAFDDKEDSASSSGADSSSSSQEQANVASYETGEAPSTGKITPPPISSDAPSTAGNLLPNNAADIRSAGDTSVQLLGRQLVLTGDNPTALPAWEEESFPAWSCNVPLENRRAIALDVEGDNSQAVLVVRTDSNGSRDYVVKIDFTGWRHIVIPNGEVAWSNGAWGWGFNQKGYDYNGTLRQTRVGFGYLPPSAKAHVTIQNLHILNNQAGLLVDPVIHIGTGILRVTGEVHDHEYLTYESGQTVNVYDSNFNLLRALPAQVSNWSAPSGDVSVEIDSSASGSKPWIELQVLTRGEPHKLSGI